MKTTFKFTILGICALLMTLVEVPPEVPFPELHLVPTAHAILGVRRRTARRTAVVVGTAAYAAGAEAAAAEQKAAAANQQAAAAPQQQAAAPAPAPAAPAPAPAASDKPLPIGTVVNALPKGCTSTPVGGVEYYYCAGNFYRAVFQGSQLVYVTAKP